MRPIEEQTILVTGATDGLGRGVAAELARRGATLLLHGRDPRRGERVLRELRAETGSDRLRYLNADFASLDEVRGLAGQISGRLDALVNNAGVGVEPERHQSRDGHELTFQVDYLAPFLLTRLLLPLLAASAPARIVNVSSAGQAPIRFDDVMLTRRYDGVQAYCQAKLAEIMMTFDLAEELDGSGVTVNCLHPASYMPTKIVTRLYTPRSTLEEGVEATVRLVASPELDGVTGRYFDRTREARADPQAYDRDARARLRALAAELTGVDAPAG